MCRNPVVLAYESLRSCGTNQHLWKNGCRKVERAVADQVQEWPVNQFRRLMVSLAAVVIVVFVLWTKRPGGWFGGPSRQGRETAPRTSDLKTLAFLSPNKLLATVGGVNL